MMRCRAFKCLPGLAGRKLLPALLLLALGSSPGQAIDLDARRMATSGAVPPRADRLGGENPAYVIVPDRYPDGGFCIPIPLGLPVLFDVLSNLDPESEDFDPVAVMNLLANPPIHMELIEPEPLDGDIIIDLGQEHLRIYWEDAALFIPQKALDFGLRLERFGLGLGRALGENWRWRMQVTPFLDGAAQAELDDALYGVLVEGDSLKAQSSYNVTADFDIAGGIAWKLLCAGQLLTDRESELYLALAPKLITGLGMHSADMQFSATTGDTLFTSETLEVAQNGYRRYTEGLSAGHGFALDLGLVLRRGPWDFGIGARDLVASISFPHTTLERHYLQEPEDGRDTEAELVIEVLEQDARHVYKIKPFWTFSAAYSQESWILMGELRLRPWQNTLHLGSEVYFDRWTLRGGLQRDSRERWQISGGGGVRLGFCELNLALATHNRFIQNKRGLALGLSLTL